MTSTTFSLSSSFCVICQQGFVSFSSYLRHQRECHYESNNDESEELFENGGFASRNPLLQSPSPPYSSQESIPPLSLSPQSSATIETIVEFKLSQDPLTPEFVNDTGESGDDQIRRVPSLLDFFHTDNQLYDTLMQTILKSCTTWRGSKLWLRLMRQYDSRIPQTYKPISRYAEQLRISFGNKDRYYKNVNTNLCLFHNDIPFQVALRLEHCRFEHPSEAQMARPTEFFHSRAFHETLGSTTYHVVALCIFVDDYLTTRWTTRSLTAIYGDIANIPYEQRIPWDIAHLPTSITAEEQMDFIRYLILTFFGRTFVAIYPDGRQVPFQIKPFILMADMPQRQILTQTHFWQYHCAYCSATHEELRDIFVDRFPHHRVRTLLDGLFAKHTSDHVVPDIMHCVFLGLIKTFFSWLLVHSRLWKVDEGSSSICSRQALLDKEVARFSLPIPPKYKTSRIPRFSKCDKSKWTATDYLLISGLCPGIGRYLSHEAQRTWNALICFTSLVSMRPIPNTALVQAVYQRLASAWRSAFPDANALPNLHCAGHLSQAMSYFGPPCLFSNWKNEKRQAKVRQSCDKSSHQSDTLLGEWLVKRGQLHTTIDFRNKKLIKAENPSSPFINQGFQVFCLEHDFILQSSLCYFELKERSGRRRFEEKCYLTFVVGAEIEFPVVTTSSVPFSLRIRQDRSLQSLKVKIPVFTPGWSPPTLALTWARYLVDILPVDIEPPATQNLTVAQLKDAIRSAGLTPAKPGTKQVVLQQYRLLLNEILQ